MSDGATYALAAIYAAKNTARRIRAEIWKNGAASDFKAIMQQVQNLEESLIRAEQEISQ